MAASTKIINWQMVGLLIGGILWGVMGRSERGGYLFCLDQSYFILLQTSLQVIVQTTRSVCCMRFVAGVGLAGELGAGITLVSELLPKNKKGNWHFSCSGYWFVWRCVRLFHL